MSTTFDDPLALGDDALIAAQRLAEWASRGPTMEEDVALANIALDQLGAARLFLSAAGDEDDLAYLRDAAEFRNCRLVELPNAPVDAVSGVGIGHELDFGWTIVKLLFLSAAQMQTYERLAASDGPLAEIAAKLVKESAYHLDHAALWTRRLGDGTAASHERMAATVGALWAYTHDLCDDRTTWLKTVEPVLREATLDLPGEGPAEVGGREGRHTGHLAALLAEMQVLHRAHPGARW
ncbi:MAG: phenylacetate-CoA oxygenase subunit PaaC [Hamadaea sp.]|nr:phenylacetate-CoA oxygenase subunit PaaC [Hamadaea sp.]